MSAKELRENLTKSLFDAGSKLDEQDKMRLAIKLELSLATVKRYMCGKPNEVRKLELAESILLESQAFISEKSLA